MKSKQIIQMINNGWNMDEIRELFKKSKEMEKFFADNIRYINERKITDFKGINKYYCSKHDCFHYKFRTTTINRKKVRVRTDSFKLCEKFALKLTKNEISLRKFKRSFRNYSIDSHKKTLGSKSK